MRKIPVVVLGALVSGVLIMFQLDTQPKELDIIKSQPKKLNNTASSSVSEVISKYKWKLFLGNQNLDNSKYNPPKVFQADESKMDASRKDYFMSIDPDFRKNISRSVPIHCYSGEYGLFPKKYRKFIDLLIEYSHFHNDQTTATTKVLVWQCSRIGTCGGFGDRMRAISMSLALAMFTRRKLYLNWGTDNTLQYLQPNVIDWNWNSQQSKSKMQNTLTLNFRSAGKAYTKRNFFVNIGKYRWRSYLTKIHGDTPIIMLNTNLETSSLVMEESTEGQKWLKDAITQAGFTNLTCYEVDRILGIAFRYLFKVDPMIIKEVESAKKVLQMNNTPFLGIHLRTGFVGSKRINDSYQVKESSWMKSLDYAVHRADRQIGNKSLIFLATDSDIAKEMAIAKYGLRFRNLDMEATHIDKTSEENGIVYMLVDLLILAQSYVHIRRISGFSFVSESICSIPAERIYYK